MQSHPRTQDNTGPGGPSRPAAAAPSQTGGMAANLSTEQMVALVGELRQVLCNEHEALKTRDAKALFLCAERKRTLAMVLETEGNRWFERHTVCSPPATVPASGNVGREDSAPFLLDDDAKVVRDLLEECWRMNLVNGALIDTNRAFTDSLAGIYTAVKDPAAGLYGATGVVIRRSSQGIIAKT